MRCQLCPDLVASRKTIVRGELFGSDLPKIVVIGEAPGVEEDKVGRPFVWTSGEELRHALRVNGLAAIGCFLTNVCLCHPLGNRDPKAEEIRNCVDNHLIPTLLAIRPHWIITVGRIAGQVLAGPDFSVEMEHGIPRPINFHGLEAIHIPAYHPAAGLHNPSKMILFLGDMIAAGNVVKGKISPHPPLDVLAGKESYQLLDKPIDTDANVVAIDTEWARGKPYCLSFSVKPGEAFVIQKGHDDLASLNSMVVKEDVTTIIQNCLYDLPVLSQMGIHPAKVVDTMILAYLLQDEPQGLKQLAYRHCGMAMTDYKDMVKGATERLALGYVTQVLSLEWPDPEPVMEWAKGEPKVRQPQNIKSKVERILRAGEDFADKWKAVKEGKEIVEAVLGPLQAGELCDIPEEKAVLYSARDADATLRIYPILWERIESLKLEDTFWRDMRAVPMVVDMMANGILIDIKAFHQLSKYFQGKMDHLQRKMQVSVGGLLDNKTVNPASYPQMSALIYDKLALHEKIGRFKAKGGKKSTASDVLKRFVDIHPIAKDIIEWREYQKLKTTYSDAVPKLVSPDGRIRTTLRITRTATGRLSSSSPNLMAQPVRSEEGRRIRGCYIAGPGNVLVSGDYSAIEMKVVASESQDERMLEIFWSGRDIHSQTASDIFGVPVNQVDPIKHRYPAKRVGFGILYMITAGGLHRELTSEGLDWSLSDCEDMIRAWFKVYKGVAEYMKRNGEFAKRYGYVRDMWGRIRFVPGIRSTNKWIRMEAERQAGNAPIQMGAQGVIKEAMGRLVPVYRDLYRDLGVKSLLQIHDDLLWEMPEAMVDVAIPQIEKVMESAVPKGFLVPATVDFKVGKRWRGMEKWSMQK